ncbi:NADH-quinone oxidoreductase subunit NuoN [Thiohalomonas denitrificans]|uniref:NADH-quinone oxidoreductase subunit NuoN n=1 Tax=Thiohalomonas denitrificans TaxID=415747 RepID=UPI0026F2F967|nr:NADH-quinone oxidoreductase subunit NuoN [Thiohalomonas denitrificans]
MNFETPDFLPVVPELFVLGMACLILVVDLFLSDRSRVVTYLMSQATLVGALVVTLGLSSPIAQVTMNGTFVLDPMATLLKSVVYIASFVAFLYAKDYLRARSLFKGEFFLLGLFAVLGMMVLISAHSMLTVYLGLELMSLSLYAMVALQRNSATASEAAMKYFILGAMASAMLLYGMSMLYGATGTLDLGELGARVQGAGPSSLVLVFGLVFLIVGIAFKLGAVPFHMWVPDVYHGAPTAVTLFVSSAPKLAAFAMLMRLLVDGLPGLHGHWQDMLILLAVLSVALGNVLAIAQANIKRLLAYSGISHVGFLLMGVLAGTPEGYAAGMYYAIAYVIMTLGGFGMVILMSRAGFEADRLEDYKGLNERSPWFALMMLILMFSMAGVPPFLGFWAKLAVLEAVVSIDLIWVAVVAVVFSVIGAFYYLRVVKYMYFDKPEDEHSLVAGSDLRFLLSANGLAVLGLGIFPGSLLALCASAIG